jgi:hypothetical protein
MRSHFVDRFECYVDVAKSEKFKVFSIAVCMAIQMLS